MESWEFEAELFPWTDWESSWVFLVVPEDVGEEIALLSGPPRGFGSVRVEVTIGTSIWRTSVFPDKSRGFVLPARRTYAAGSSSRSATAPPCGCA